MNICGPLQTAVFAEAKLFYIAE